MTFKRAFAALLAAFLAGQAPGFEAYRACAENIARVEGAPAVPVARELAPAPAVELAPLESLALPAAAVDLGVPAAAPEEDSSERAPGAEAQNPDARFEIVFDGSKAEAADVKTEAPGAGKSGDKSEGKAKKQDVTRLPVEDQLEHLLKKYKVPDSEAALRKKLTLQAWERVKLDIPLFLHEPNVDIQPGSWWMTAGDARRIFVPIEDLFIRAVDPAGVQEAVGAAIHETLHYVITRVDKNDPLAQKYAMRGSPSANQLLFNIVEDIRINSWGLLRQPGYKPYMDAIYDALWPENPGDVEALKQSRLDVLSRFAVTVKKNGQKKQWIAPHVQYAYAAIYHWRHRKLPPFLTDPAALAAFEKTKDAFERARNVHPQTVGGLLLEMKKHQAWREAFGIVDREIYPEYEKLVQKSKDDLQKMKNDGAEIEENDPGDEGQPSQEVEQDSGEQGGDQKDRKESDKGQAQENKQGTGQEEKKDAQDGKDGASADGKKPEDQKKGGKAGKSVEEIIEDMNKDASAGVHRRSNPEDEHAHENSGEPGPSDSDGKIDDDNFHQRREKAIGHKEKIQASYNIYERYRLRATELGLIGKVDGVIKKILLPTKHSRLSRLHYHEGDEPDMDKYHDDVAQGRYDTAVMRRWNRKIKRSAKISLVLDVSGSMAELSDKMETPLDFAFLGIVAWMEVCQKNGLDFEVVLFGEKVAVAHPFGKALNRQAKEALLSQVVGFKFRGGTAIGEAVKTAYEDVVKQNATDKFIIVATDEDHNSGEGPERWTAEARKKRIVTIAMVIGDKADGLKKHFDYAVRVQKPQDFPGVLLDVLKKAIRSILGRGAGLFAFLAASAALCSHWLAHLGGPVSLGFGAPAPAPDLAPWRDVENKISEGFSSSGPSRAGDLRKETADILRNEPGLALETAIGRAYDKVHRTSLAERVTGYLRDGVSFIAPVDSHIVDMYAFKGKLHLGARYVFDGKVVRPTAPEETPYGPRTGGRLPVQDFRQINLLDVGVVRFQTELGGVDYLVAEEGIYRRSGPYWQTVGHFREAAIGAKITHINLINGKLYVATDQGKLWVQEGDQWRVHVPFMYDDAGNWRGWTTALHYIGLVDGKVEVVSASGIRYWNEGEHKWKAFYFWQGGLNWKYAKTIFGVVLLGQELYYCVDPGLSRREGDRFIKVSDEIPGSAKAALDGRIYFLKRGALWALNPRADKIQSQALAEDLERAIAETREQAGPTGASDGVIRDENGHPVFGEPPDS